MSSESRPFLDRGATFDGKLTFSGTLRIDGHLRGTGLSDGTLVVGEPGLVQADLEVGVLVVLGSVVGSVRASERVEVGSTGRLEGEIVTPRLSLQEGGQVEARVSMRRAPNSGTPRESAANPRTNR